MDCKEFMNLWMNMDLRNYIISQAKRRSNCIFVQEDYVQEAWLAISCIPYGYWNIDSYKEVALSAIFSAYWQENKMRLMMVNNIVRAKKQRMVIYEDNSDSFKETIKDLY